MKDLSTPPPLPGAWERQPGEPAWGVGRLVRLVGRTAMFRQKLVVVCDIVKQLDQDKVVQRMFLDETFAFTGWDARHGSVCWHTWSAVYSQNLSN